MVISAIGFSNAAPTNNSHYNDFLKTGTVGHLFPEDTKEQIFNIGTQLTDYRENELPTNDEFNDFINTIDAFYSNTIKGVLTNSYNEYADETGKPRATSVKFAYNDYNGNNNILRITDESGKTYDVEQIQMAFLNTTQLVLSMMLKDKLITIVKDLKVQNQFQQNKLY